MQQWDDDAVHAASHQARVERDATLRHIVVSFGGGVVRVNPSVELAGAGSRAELFGLSYSDAGQHLESQVYLHHKGADTKGDVLYKGALQGAGARSVWIGDVLIGPDAVGTDSYEANRNLVLTDGARADSIPNLEIETGDIRGAGHASATGRFDDEQLFYLQARGITEDEARRLVVLGFLTEIVQKIGIPALEAELFAAIEAELARRSPDDRAARLRAQRARAGLPRSASRSTASPSPSCSTPPARCTPSATPARTATSRSPRASSTATRSSAGPTARPSR